MFECKVSVLAMENSADKYVLQLFFIKANIKTFHKILRS